MGSKYEKKPKTSQNGGYLRRPTGRKEQGRWRESKEGEAKWREGSGVEGVRRRRMGG